MTLWIIHMAFGETDADIPLWERCVGPYRSRNVADNNADRMRERYNRRLLRKVEKHGGHYAVRIFVEPLDNRAGMYHSRDLENAITETLSGMEWNESDRWD